MSYTPIIEILKNPLLYRKERYGSTDIDKIIIDGNTFGGYKTFSSFWEKTYPEQPERSMGGVIDNLNDHATFTTFHVKCNFAMMSIEDYRDLYKLILSKNEFTVTAYNVLTNSPITCKMYFAPDQMPKLYAVARRLQGEKFVEVLGIQDYTIELIGTNADIDKISVLYYDGNGGLLGSQETYANVEFLLGNGITVPNLDGKVFNGKWVRESEIESGISLPTNQAIISSLITNEEVASNTIKWYAQYETEKQYSLSFSYGLGTPLKDINGKDITSIKFIPNQDTIGTAIANANIGLQTGGTFSILPTSESPIYKEVVNGEEKVYPTHTNKGWRKGNSIYNTLVDNSTLLNVENDMIIYQVFEPVKHSITFVSNGGTQYQPLTNVAYGENVAIPIPYKQNYVFKGWYLDSEFKNAFTTMLPYNITLYAQWE